MRDIGLAVAQTDPGLPTDLPPVEPLLARAGWFVVGFLLVLVVGWYVAEPAVSRVVGARNRDNPTLQEAISRYLRALVLVVAVVAGLAGAGFDRLLGDSAIVFAAVTLAVGVAGQAVIGSLVSGLALVVDPQFNVGNYIEWPGGEGEVTSITLRVTRVRTLDGGLVTIPNTTLTDSAVVRPFESGRGRIVERVGVAYGDDLDRALAVLTETAAAVADAADEPAPEATVDELSGDAVVLRTQFHVTDPRQTKADARAEFVRAAKANLEAEGITVSPVSKRDLEGRIEVADAAPSP